MRNEKKEKYRVLSFYRQGRIPLGGGSQKRYNYIVQWSRRVTTVGWLKERQGLKQIAELSD